MRFSLTTLALAVLGVACSAGNNGNSGGSGGSGGGAGGSTNDGGAGGKITTTSGGGGSGAGFAAGGGGGGFEGTPEVFGHSSSTLYKLNPETKAVTVVGDFNGCASVYDIALDKDSKIYGSNASGLYAIDKMTAACTEIAAGNYPNSLSFVPAGTLDPNVEALVGFLDDQYVRIDPVSGTITEVGNNWNNGFVSSGDVVSVKNGPTYLTIKDAIANDNICQDCLVEINPATGAIIKNFNSIGYDGVFGTAFWAGSVYGFTKNGELFEITIQNNQLSTSLIPTDPGLSFWGAGSTTSAPPTPQ